MTLVQNQLIRNLCTDGKHTYEEIIKDLNEFSQETIKASNTMTKTMSEADLLYSKLKMKALKSKLELDNAPTNAKFDNPIDDLLFKSIPNSVVKKLKSLVEGNFVTFQDIENFIMNTK